MVASVSCSLPLLAQLPTNDAFPGGPPLSDHVNAVTGSNVGATSEAGEPNHADSPATASIWWSWVAPDSGLALVSTLGTTFDTVLAVYTGDTVNALTLVAANDDAPGLATSLVSFQAVQGATYRIAVDGYGGATGPIELRLGLPGPPTPPVITSQPIGQTVPDNAGSNITFTVSVTGSFPRFFDWQKNESTVAFGTNASYSIDNARLGDTGNYRVIVTNFFGSVTSSVAVLNVRAALSQDAFAGRVIIPGAVATVTSHNHGATTEAGEPVHAGVNSGASVWWTWTAPQNGLVRLDTAGSTNSAGEVLDTVLAVYSGANLGTLVPVAANNDETPGLVKSSQLVFRAVAGSTYQVAVAGVRDAAQNVATGDITLHLTEVPDNDYFANALLFPPGVTTVYDDNSSATLEAGEPPHAGNPGGKSVWWYWVAPTNGTYVLDTVGSSIDTVLEVYTGTTLNALTVVGEDDNRSDDGASLVRFLAKGGTTYRFAVDGYSGANGVAGGRIVLNLNVPLESNDNFANRTTLAGQTNRVTSSNVGASKETGEPVHGGNEGGRSVWWTWTAHLTGPVLVTTHNSTFDTILAVYTGTKLSSLVLVGENDDANPDDPAAGSLVLFNATAGETYQIAVDSYQSDDGTVPEGTVELALIQASVPVAGGNDLFANRFPITGTTNTVIGNNTSATAEPGEPNHAHNDGGRSIWWSWVAPASTPVAIHTLGSSFHTLLGVYRGSAVNALTLVADDRGSAGPGHSVVAFEAVQGVEYQIAVDGFNDGAGAEAGVVVLNLRQFVPGALHANDDFENASPISEPFLTVTDLNIGATRQPGEPAHGGIPNGRSVWWTWTAPTEGPVTISTVNSQFDTVLAVYTGTEVGALSLVAQNDDIDPLHLQSQVTFQAAAGATYRIAVDDYGNEVGLINLSISPGTDAPSTPKIQQPPLDQTRFQSGGGGGADVPFKVLATGSLPLSFQWLRNGFPIPDATNDLLTVFNAGAADIGSYQVTVSNRFGVVTSAPADFTFQSVPFNDDFANRALITGSSTVAKGSVLGATTQLNEPHHGGETGGRSVWWRWVAPADGLVELNTFGSAFDTLLAVYQGGALGSLALIAENDDLVIDHDSASRVLFTAIAGQEYQIAVDSYKTNGPAGSVRLAVRQPPLVDNTKPSISISAPSASLTKSGPVTYTVTYADANFARSTLGVTDISLNTTGNASGSVAVAGDGTTRTVTIHGITGDGTLGISLAAGTATDAVGNSADATGASATFAVDNTKPVVTIQGPFTGPTPASPVTYTISYADPNLEAVTLGVGDIQLNRTGTANGTVSVLNSGSAATVTISSIVGEGSLSLSLGAGTARDRAGNTADAAGPSGVLNITDAVAPAKPGKPDLIAAHDTGRANSDDVTAASPITITGTGESGTIVTLQDGFTVLGSGNVVAGSWSLTLATVLPGPHSLTAILTDAAGNSSDESDPLILIVDRTGPTLSAIPAQNTTEDGVVVVNFTVGDTQTTANELSVEAVSSNLSLFPGSNLILSGAGPNRALVATPVANLSGEADIGLTVTDVAGNSTPLIFHVTVVPVNDQPTLASILDQNVLAASGSRVLTLSGISAGPGENQNLTISAVSDNPSVVGHPATVLTVPTGTLTFAPVGRASGQATISVILTDDGGVANGGVNSVTNKFTITVQPANLNPVAQFPLADRAGVYGAFLSFSLPANSFADPDPGDTLSYFATGTPPGMTFDPAMGTFTGTPLLAGAFVVSVTATDTGGLSAASSFRLTVSKAHLTITANSLGKVYGEPLPALTATYTGFVAGDNAASLVSPAVLTTPATTTSGAGSYPILAAGATSPNYEITFSSGTLTVSQAVLRITTPSVTSVYGDAFPDFTPILAGLVAGDTLASLDVPVKVVPDATANSKPGTYAIKITGGDDNNYSVTRVDGLLMITPAQLKVKSDNLFRWYRAENPALTGTITGLKNGETLAVNHVTMATSASPVGTYPIIPEVTDPNGVLSHYLLEVVPGTLEVLDGVEVGGVAFDGYVAGGTVFFDANHNRKDDPGEPFTTTGPDGHFFLDFPVADFDTNHDNGLDPSEGVLALTGGVDIVTGLPLKVVLSAPLGATVITPLTTLIATALEQNPGLSPTEAHTRIKTALGIPATVDLNHYDPFAGVLANEASALKVLSAGALVQDTLLEITALLGPSSSLDATELARQVTRAILEQITSGNPDLSLPGVVRTIINACLPPQPTLDAALLQAVAEMIANNNAAKNEAAATNLPPAQVALEIGKLQGVAQRDLAAAFGEAAAPGVSPEDALAILRETRERIATRTAPVGANSAGDTRAGRFGFDTRTYQVSTLGKGSAKITVIRTDGNQGAASVGLQIGNSGQLALQSVEFGHREISRTIDILPLVSGNSELANASSIELSLQGVVYSGANPPGLGPVTTAILILKTIPTITDPTNVLASAGDQVTFGVTVTGFPKPSIQWTRNGIILASQTNSLLTLSNVKPEDEGTYQATASNVVGMATSKTASLTLKTAPGIQGQTTRISVSAGASTNLQFAITGTLPLQYQWRKNGSDLPGQTNAVLQLNKVTTADSGAYSLFVENSYGAAVSPETTVTVVEVDLNFQFLAITRATDGAVELTLRLPLGRRYVLEQSTDLKTWSVTTEVTPQTLPHVLKLGTLPSAQLFFRLKTAE